MQKPMSGSPTISQAACGTIGTWVTFGLCMVLFIAGAQKISTSLYDLRSVVNRPGWPVPGQITLDHPYQGMVAMWTDRAQP